MTKRGPGRPKTRPEPKGIGRAALAERHGVNVKTVDKWMREGLPVAERRAGLIYFDPATADSWIEEFESRPAPIPVAPVLHPSDIRHRERSLASEIRRINFGLKAGQLIRPEFVASEAGAAFADLNARLNSLPSLVAADALTADNAIAMLAPVMEVIASDFDIDSDSRWPKPSISIVPDDSEDEDATEFEPEPAVTFKPVLPDSDPQAQFAAAKVAEHEAALTDLRNCITHGDAMEMARTISSGVRRELARLPARVAKQLRPGDPFEFVDATLAYAADATKAAILRNVFKTEPEFELVKPKRHTAAEGELDDVAGSGTEFEDEGV